MMTFSESLVAQQLFKIFLMLNLPASMPHKIHKIWKRPYEESVHKFFGSPLPLLYNT